MRYASRYFARVAATTSGGNSGPGGVFGQELKTLLALPSTQRVFQRSRRRKSVLRGLVLNTWLIESWPVVTEYEWTYHDVQKAASQKFESDEMTENLISSEASEDESPLDTAKRIEDRCKSLGLRLSSGGRAKAGKPTVSEVDPPFSTLTEIQGLLDPMTLTKVLDRVELEQHPMEGYIEIYLFPPNF